MTRVSARSWLFVFYCIAPVQGDPFETSYLRVFYLIRVLCEEFYMWVTTVKWIGLVGWRSLGKFPWTRLGLNLSEDKGRYRTSWDLVD